MSKQHSLRVLLVDDHLATLRGLFIWLTGKGYEVFPFGTMHEALQFAKDAPFDVLISDIGLPDGDGWDLVKRLRAENRFYAIAISGLTGAREKGKSLDAGFSQHLAKPFDPEALHASLQLIAEANRFA